MKDEFPNVGFKLMSQKIEPLPGIETAGRVGKDPTPPGVENPGGGSNIEREMKKYKPSNQLSHLFNSYTQAFNKRYHRHGTLFEKPFERIRITHEKYFRNLAWYIHNNPVHHGFVEHMIENPWSSYQTMISVKPTKLSREKVVGWFNSTNEFQVFHQEDQNIKDIRRFIIE